MGHSFGHAEPFPAGTYELRVACVGEGLVSFLWSATSAAPDETTTGALTLTCHLPEKNATGMVTLTRPGEIEFTARPRDDRAAGQAFFAVAITDPRAVLARDLLGPSGDSAVLSEVGSTAAPLGFSIEGVEPGRYQLTLVCVGAGPLRIEVRSVDGELTGQDTVCTDDGAVVYHPVEVNRTGGISVTVRPLRGAEGRAGYALRVDRLPDTPV
jgi:hypothetical protein